jgi:catechol 2,3-dioxygenase
VTARVGIVPPGYRLPDAAHIGGVRLQVADLERSIAYYREVTGFAVLDRDDARAPSARLGNGDDRGVLLELVEKKRVRAVPRRGLLGLYHFAILLPTRPHLGAFIRHVTERRIPVGMSDHLVSQSIYLYDPDGLGIEVYADQPRSSWQVRNREYVAAVDPLDTRELLHLSEGTAWSGLPSGTVIGHVHHYVNDLPQAEAFYHAGLGFDKVGWSIPGALFISAGGYHHHVGLNTWAAGSPVATDDDARLLDWELVVPTPADVAAAARSLGQSGVEVKTGANDVLARDPWQIAVRISPGTA